MKKKDVSKLRMSLEEIRNSINLEKDEWINISSTNCYAYALGLDISEQQIIERAYIPGVISNSKRMFIPRKIFSYEDLLYNIFLDFKCLDIDFREINPMDSICRDEWKIALFVTKVYSDKRVIGLEDFHFLRFRDDGFWYHKNGYNGIVSNMDSYDDVIVNPKDCILCDRTYKKCLSLKLK